MSTDLALGTVFEGFETDARPTVPVLAPWMARVRQLVWPPACSHRA